MDHWYLNVLLSEWPSSIDLLPNMDVYHRSLIHYRSFWA